MYNINKIDLLSLSLGEIRDIIDKLGLEKYRAEQIYSWIYKVNNFAEMSNISSRHRDLLSEHFYIKNLEIDKKLVASDGTIKYLFELGDGNKIESVYMRYKHGNSVCISTQAGCRFNCAFCASAIGGLARNLSPAEMLLQVINIARDTQTRVSNIVLMGIGEPLDNYDNAVKFIELAGSALDISLRRISLSTCGLTDKINELKLKKLPVTLSVSLHAPNDELRSKIMPVNNKYKISGLLEACKDYAEYTGRRVSFEYILINNFNDSEQNARELASRVKNILCHVNLIMLNKINKPGSDLSPPGRKKAEIFAQVLENSGINATFRRRCGDQISASCGQLRGGN